MRRTANDGGCRCGLPPRDGPRLLTLAGISFIWKYWLLSNVVVYLPTKPLVKRMIQDPQFRSSVDYGIRLLLQFINAIVVFIVFTCTHNVLWGLGMVGLCMLSAWVTPRIFVMLRDVWYGLKSPGKTSE